MHGNLIDTFVLHLLVKTNRFPFENVCLAALPVNPYVLVKPGKHNVTLTPYYTADLSELQSFSLVRVCHVDDQEVTEYLATVHL